MGKVTFYTTLCRHEPPSEGCLVDAFGARARRWHVLLPGTVLGCCDRLELFIAALGCSLVVRIFCRTIALQIRKTFLVKTADED
eukprot:1481847-Amphidinium_carterae.1